MSSSASPVTGDSQNAHDLSRWQDLVRERFVALDIRPGAATTFGGSVSSRTVGPLDVSRVRSVAQTFRRTRGLARWIRFRRLEHARAALTAEPNRPVAVIAAHYGFFDPTVFARAFRDEYGVSPREYRRSVSG